MLVAVGWHPLLSLDLQVAILFVSLLSPPLSSNGVGRCLVGRPLGLLLCTPFGLNHRVVFLILMVISLYVQDHSHGDLLALLFDRMRQFRACSW